MPQKWLLKSLKLRLWKICPILPPNQLLPQSLLQIQGVEKSANIPGVVLNVKSQTVKISILNPVKTESAEPLMKVSPSTNQEIVHCGMSNPKQKWKNPKLVFKIGAKIETNKINNQHMMRNPFQIIKVTNKLNSLNIQNIPNTNRENTTILLHSLKNPLGLLHPTNRTYLITMPGSHLFQPNRQVLIKPKFRETTKLLLLTSPQPTAATNSGVNQETKVKYRW